MLLNGGITSSHNVLKALALGARACLTGKAYLFGLAAGGEAGVTMALTLLRSELEVSMALCGVRKARDVLPRRLIDP